MTQPTNNLRIKSLRTIPSPHLLLDELPITDEVSKTVNNFREQIAAIMNGQDDRLVIVVGPCSIHDPQAAMEYAEKLKKYAVSVANELCIVMRVYFKNHAPL